MSATEHETRDASRVSMDHHHYVYFVGTTPDNFAAAVAAAVAQATANINGAGNGSGGATTVAPPTPPTAPPYPYTGHGSGAGIDGPGDGAWRWLLYLIGAAAVIAIVCLIAFGVVKAYDAWFGGGSASNGQRTVFVADFLKTRGVDIGTRLPAKYEKLANGSYLVTISRYGRQQFHMRLKPGMVNTVPGNFSHETAVLSYYHDPLFTQPRWVGRTPVRVNDPFAPHSGGDATTALIGRYNDMPVGVLAQQHLRHVTIRVPSSK